jgi:hypothetical protein
MESFNKIDVFDSTVFSRIQEFVLDHIKHSDNLKYASSYGRYWNLIEFPKDIEDILVSTAQSEFNKDLDILYTQCVKYQIKDGVAPALVAHTDNLFCTHTMNLIIDTNIDWPLIVQDVEFPSKPNSAVFLKGDTESHWRPEYPSKDEDDYLIAVFVNLATKGSEMAEITKKFRGMSDLTKSAFLDHGNPHGQ